jgi:hypothetical protein
MKLNSISGIDCYVRDFSKTDGYRLVFFERK